MASGESKQGEALAPLGVVTALSSALALAACMVAAALLHEVVAVTELAPPLTDHHQDAETLTFLLSFAVLLPFGVLAGSRICDRVGAGANAGSLSAVVALLCTTLGAGLIAVRIAVEIDAGAGPAALVTVGVIWFAVAALLLRRASSPARRAELSRLAGHGIWAWGLAGVVLAGVALSFATLSSIDWPLLITGAVAVAALLYARERVQLPRVGTGLGRALDIGVVLLLLVAVPNIVIFSSGTAAAGFQTAIVDFHQNFYLGPANQVMAGHPMLVDTLSQYGVGSILFLAGLFELIPIGNRTLGLIEGLLSAGMFIGAYAALRICGVARLLAAAALAVAVIVAVYGLVYPLGGLLQHGAFRFGLPIGIVVGAVAEARWPQHAKAARGLQLLTVAVASIWALEGFAYTLITLAAVAAFDLATALRGERRSRLIRWVAQVAAACLIAHLVFALATLAATGELPDWGWYLNTLREFLVGEIGDLTYDFSPFSPGLAAGAIYLVSATGLILLLRRRPDVVAGERTTLVAITAMTAFGVALFSYLINRSADHIVPYVCLPAFSIAALWLTLLDRPSLAVSAGARRGALGIVGGVSVLLIAVAASQVPTRFAQSPLGLARPGGASLSAALDRLWHPPPLHPEGGEGVELLERHMPGESESIVLTQADRSVEILIRAERGNAVPLGDPWEDSFVPDDHLEPLGEFVDGLEGGERMLIDASSREALDAFRDDPTLDPLATSGTEGSIVPTGLASLQLWTLDRIERRFELRTIASSSGGLEVVELEPRTA